MGVVDGVTAPSTSLTGRTACSNVDCGDTMNSFEALRVRRLCDRLGPVAFSFCLLMLSISVPGIVNAGGGGS